MLRLLSAATVLSIGTVLFLALLVPRFVTGYSEREVRVTLQSLTPGDTLDQRVEAALDDGDIALALQFEALANELGQPLAPATRTRLEDAQGTVATALRNAGDFAGAYITGHADSAAGLAGAVVSDLTVVGDVRDIISEGGKAAVGEDYSEFLLTLAAIGLVAEGVTIATGGTSLVFKVGISVLKVAKRTGNLTVDLTRQLTRLARAASRRAPAQSMARAPGGATSDAMDETASLVTLSRGAARAELRGTLRAVNTMAVNAGPAESVKLLRYARTTGDVSDIATFTGRFGRTSRAVAEITGKTTLRAFRTAVRGVKMLVAFLWSLAAWLISLIALAFVKRVLRAILNMLRGAFVSLALP